VAGAGAGGGRGEFLGRRQQLRRMWLDDGPAGQTQTGDIATAMKSGIACPENRHRRAAVRAWTSCEQSGWEIPMKKWGRWGRVMAPSRRIKTRDLHAILPHRTHRIGDLTDFAPARCPFPPFWLHVPGVWDPRFDLVPVWLWIPCPEFYDGCVSTLVQAWNWPAS